MISITTDAAYKQIMTLIKNGVNIVEVNGRYFLYNSFDASSRSTASSVEYCQFSGMEVTDFINKNHAITNPAFYFQAFTAYISVLETVRIKFNCMIPYFLYTSV